MRTSHTPAPWFVKEYTRGTIEIQCDPTHSGADLFDRNRHENALYNARLAAAAPDMYEALNTAVKELEWCAKIYFAKEFDIKLYEGLNKIKAALKLANP